MNPSGGVRGEEVEEKEEEEREEEKANENSSLDGPKQGATFIRRSYVAKPL